MVSRLVSIFHLEVLHPLIKSFEKARKYTQTNARGFLSPLAAKCKDKVENWCVCLYIPFFQRAFSYEEFFVYTSECTPCVVTKYKCS